LREVGAVFVLNLNEKVLEPMIDYIRNLLPRLRQFSKGLNDTALFADAP
jgi:hypothetical protein